MSAFAVLCAVDAKAEGCPTAKDEIATDRPDVTNSSLVVPIGLICHLSAGDTFENPELPGLFAPPLPTISVPNVSVRGLVGGCGSGRVPDPQTLGCRGPAGFR